MPQHDWLPVRRSRFDDRFETPHDETSTRRHHRRHFDDADGSAAPRRPHDPAPPDDGPATGDRWSTWDVGQHGPIPYPDWLVTELADIVANPQGPAFLVRDVRIVTDWFTAHGLPPQLADAAGLAS